MREPAPRWSRASRLPRLPQAGKKASEEKRGSEAACLDPTPPPEKRGPSLPRPPCVSCPAGSEARTPQPLLSPVPRGVLASARSHSPAATAEGPGALEFPPASSRARAPPAGLTDRTGRRLGSSGTSPHDPLGAASDPVTCGARPSPVSLRLQEGATPAALGH